MYQVKIDRAKNYLHLELKGLLSKEEIEEGGRGIDGEIKKLSPGFTIINDISEFKPSGPETVEALKQVQAEVAQTGVGKVIRITGSAVLGGLQFRRSHQESGAGYEVIEVRDFDEALKHL